LVESYTNSSTFPSMGRHIIGANGDAYNNSKT